VAHSCVPCRHSCRYHGGRAPLEKDVTSGSRVLQYFAITAARAGDKELALQQPEAGLRAPVASLMLSYGALKLFSVWDPLRGDPRFEKIVTSLAVLRKGATLDIR